MITPNSDHLEHARPEVDVAGQDQQVVEEGAGRRAVEEDRGRERPEDAGPERQQVEDRHHQPERDDAGQDQVADRVDPEHLERLELLADLAGADLGGDRRAERAGDDRRRQDRAELAQERDRRDRRDPVDRAERRGERAALDPDRREADHEGDDRRRAERDPEREDELADELLPPREAGADQLGADLEPERRHPARAGDPAARGHVRTGQGPAHVPDPVTSRATPATARHRAFDRCRIARRRRRAHRRRRTPVFLARISPLRPSYAPVATVG